MPDKKKVRENLRKLLPKKAQEIFLEAYNHAYEQYGDPAKRRGGRVQSREEVANKVAWAAVKKKYEKGEDGKWHPMK